MFIVVFGPALATKSSRSLTIDAWNTGAEHYPDWLEKHATPLLTAKLGGAEALFRFMEEELKPALAKRYHIDPNKQTLFGHSYGGLFALGVLMDHPEAFQSYIISSPSLWWNDSEAFDRARRFAKRQSGVASPAAARVVLSVGARELKPGPFTTETSTPQGGSSASRPLSQACREMAALLESLEIPGISVEFQEFPEEEHGTVLMPAATHGVRRVFQSYGS